MCDATGICMPLTAPGDMSNGAGSIDAGAASGASTKVQYCPPGYTVRQGAMVAIAVPFADPTNVTASTNSDLVVHPAMRLSDGSVAVLVEAPHGLPAGDGDIGPHRRIVTITTTNGEAFVRNVLVTVSHITADPTGDDANDGSAASPFATFKQAAEAAYAGDTINLMNFKSADDETKCAAPGSSYVSVRSGVAVIGGDTQYALLPIEVRLEGDATLENLELTGARLVISQPGSQVALRNDKVRCGVTMIDTASVVPGPGVVGTDLTISGRTQVWNDLVSQSPMLIEAVGATVTIEDSSSVLMTSPVSDLETMRFHGGSQTLTILSGSIVQNPTGHAAVHLEGSANVFFDGANFFGPVEIDDPASSVIIKSSTFALGADSGELVFRGHDMQIKDTDFIVDVDPTATGDATVQGDGIVQDNLDSTVTVTNTHFNGYQHFGYKLLMGTVTLETSSFNHDAKVPLTNEGPWALVVRARGDSDSMVTSRSTMYDVAMPLMPCEILGPASLDGLYSISETVKIDFY
jgi:hypothetical protein